jgi:hypothetical protein
MTRDETIALWETCEAARAAAIAEGKSEDDAHKPAKAIWNAWANEMLAERKALERSGTFQLTKLVPRAGWIAPPTIAQNTVSNDWLSRSTTNFSEFTFSGFANFTGFIFPGNALFGYSELLGHHQRPSRDTIFERQARFFDSAFWLDASFDRVKFQDQARFVSVIFHGNTRFAEVIFKEPVLFFYTKFKSEVWFGQSKFLSFTGFGDCEFSKRSGFLGIECKSSFNLGNAVFQKVPDFTQANFVEAPSFDSVRLPKTRFWGGGNAAVIAAYRALRRIAIQGHDHENEARAFKGEVRSKRFSVDWPWHPVFWFGVIYDILADFGRSALRPVLAWSLCIVIFAVYFLGQNPDIGAKRKGLHRHGFIGQTIAYGATALDATRQVPTAFCYPGTPPTPGNQPREVQTGFTGLVEDVRATTNLVNEALSIAYHNAVIILDSSGDSAHRAFGCLYGVERYGGNPVAFVPRSVAIASGIQKLLSAIFIFLFGLAVRNMLKVK